MAGFLDGIMKGLATLAPQDTPDMKLFNAQRELKEITEKENAVYTQLGRKVYAEGGREAYPDAAIQLDALEANRNELQQRIAQAQDEKAAKEKADAEAAAAKAAMEADRTCPSCGTVNYDGCKFCSECGTRLPEAAPQPKKRFCTSCGTEVENGMKFCSTCGAKQ